MSAFLCLEDQRFGPEVNKHVIFGAGGTTANALTRELLNNHHTIRLVSRRPVNTTGATISWVKADLMVYEEVVNAAKGASVIYLCNGVGYKNQDWKDHWPVIMQNVIDAAKKTGARLLFFDNTYMYGRVTGSMTESTPYNPCSVKGEVRARIAAQFMHEVNNGNIAGAIARAPAFYGTDSRQSVLDSLVIDRFVGHQKARWFGDPRFTHNFGYLPDMGKALYLLGQDRRGDGQVWHLPTAPPITGLKFIELAAEIYGAEPGFFRINKPLLRLTSLFNQAAASQLEMFYNWEQDFNFVSSKFEQYFNVQPTSYAEGIKPLSEGLYKKRSQ
jgi:nucleoside-diphosphate-sugar epimerase